MTDWEKIFATSKTNMRYLILERPQDHLQIIMKRATNKKQAKG